MRIGFTGHQGLTGATRRAVTAALAAFLADLADDDLVAITSLAEGADQIFALTVLAAGGRLHVIVPSLGYEHTFTDEQAQRNYFALLSQASETTSLPFAAPSEDAYLATGQAVVDRCDRLVAVWDGRPAVGKGGTGDIVIYADELGVDRHIIWPAGARRG
ncbi:hypothetical protein [Actinoplanes sp. NPDC051859]|uniref:hypothetical protein n=1 Tax=Actinoplanes sp. NPDC051859 TaxID=3363909 RepID=UPI00379CEEA6